MLKDLEHHDRIVGVHGQFLMGALLYGVAYHKKDDPGEAGDDKDHGEKEFGP